MDFACQIPTSVFATPTSLEKLVIVSIFNQHCHFPLYWLNDFFQDRICPGKNQSCNGQGICDQGSGLCICNEGYTGLDCSGLCFTVRNELN